MQPIFLTIYAISASCVPTEVRILCLICLDKYIKENRVAIELMIPNISQLNGLAKLGEFNI